MCGLTIFSAVVPAQSFTAVFSFSNVTTLTGRYDPGPAPQIKGFQFGDFYSSTAAANPNASGRFSFTGWPAGATDGSDDYSIFTAALSPFDYYEIGLRVSPGYTLALSSLAFHVRRSSTGVRTFCIRSDRDNFTDNLPAATGTNTSISVIPDNVFFWNFDNAPTASDQKGCSVTLGTDFGNITDSVTFRFFAWNSETSGGTFSIDNVSFTGVVMDSAFYTGTKTLYETGGVFVYPNPCTNGTVIIRSDAAISSVSVFDHEGTQVPALTLALPGALSLDVSDLAPGIYCVQLKHSNGVTRRKLVIVPGK